MCCKRLAENTGHKKIAKNSPFAHHRTTLSGYIFAMKACIDNRKKNLLNSHSFFTCPDNMVNFGSLTPEVRWRVWGTPANFNRFRILASLLHQRRSTEVNQTLHGVWPSPGLIHYIYVFEILTQRNFARCKIHFASKSCVLLHWRSYCTALEQWASGKLWGM